MKRAYRHQGAKVTLNSINLYQIAHINRYQPPKYCFSDKSDKCPKIPNIATFKKVMKENLHVDPHLHQDLPSYTGPPKFPVFFV